MLKSPQKVGWFVVVWCNEIPEIFFVSCTFRMVANQCVRIGSLASIGYFMILHQTKYPKTAQTLWSGTDRNCSFCCGFVQNCQKLSHV